VLRPLAIQTHPDLLVGLQTSDDAAVYRLRDDLAIVQTVDFFTPIVDDPWTYGAIAAANSMSDIYAMGGDVLLALNVAGFPESLPADIVTAIFRGAADKVAEAGGIIGGGHTVTDAEPKFGLAVTGTIDPNLIFTKGGARPGDRLFLTKPIGTGVVATALKRDQVAPADLDAAVASMLTLNRAASRAARAAGGIHACTDITGFGLLGHASEMASRSDARLRIRAADVPSLPGALGYAAAGAIAGGLTRNRQYFESAGGGIAIAASVDPTLATLLFDPQTSGGLLIALDPARADAFQTACAAEGATAWEIGDVGQGVGISVI
jgi:selenide, water dikinase